MIMIRLGFQEHTVDVDGQLFDHGMRQIGHGMHDRVVRRVGGRAGLQIPSDWSPWSRVAVV